MTPQGDWDWSPTGQIDSYDLAWYETLWDKERDVPEEVFYSDYSVVWMSSRGLMGLLYLSSSGFSQWMDGWTGGWVVYKG